MRHISSLCSLLTLLTTCALAAEPAAPPAVAAPAGAAPVASRIVSVTVYQTSALVTRELDVPAVAGPVELVVGPLPASTVNSSLYSEGTDGVRVLTTRYRTRVIRETAVEEVRKIEASLKDVRKTQQDLQKQIQTSEQNLAFLTKLEEFTSVGLKQITEKGLLNADAITNLAKYIMDTRAVKAQESVQLQQKLQASQEQEQFLQRELAKVSATSDKTIREAIVVVDNERAAASHVRLNYLVSAAAWRPQYKLRAGKEKEDVVLEYLAAITQQTGEDWRNVEIVLSTAQPLLNAAPPELAMLDIAASPSAAAAGIMVNGGKLNIRSDDNRRQVQQYRNEAQSLANSADSQQAAKRFNDAAAWQQGDEISNPDAVARAGEKRSPGFQEGQSVTFHLDRKLSVPWRDDEQLIEVTRLSMKPDYFYKAVPVLTQHVYRLARLTNESKYVILPGEATVYLGTDFVGRTGLPLVAIGEQFTAGFGVDPQLQVVRVLVDKTKTIQGGNQVLKFDYRILVSSYKPEAVKLQLWDRLPHSETEAVNITMLNTSRELSADPTYVRDEKPKNLLRWDLTVEPGSRGEKAMPVTYQFKLEFAREAAIERFLSK